MHHDLGEDSFAGPEDEKIPFLEVDISKLNPGDVVRATTRTGSLYELTVIEPLTCICGMSIELNKLGLEKVCYARSRQVKGPVAVGKVLQHCEAGCAKLSESQMIVSIVVLHGKG